jgi:hypothetical protein
MAADRRLQLTGGLMIASVLCAFPAFGEHGEGPKSEGRAILLGSVMTTARVRTEDVTIAKLIRHAAGASHTFRTLVQALEATDGIVYLRAGRCGRVRACLLHRIAVSESTRMLYVVVDAQRHDIALMAAIAHELQHAIEVLSAPRITSDAQMLAFYRMHGLKMRGVFETRTAIEAGDTVRAELRRSLRGRSETSGASLPDTSVGTSYASADNRFRIGA